MILTITLNPLVEKRFVYENVKMNSVNRTDKEYYRAGGKGINVSRQLDKLNMKNIALTFLGGGNGKILRNLLTTENINFTAVSSKQDTRLATVAENHAEENVTAFIGKNPVMSKNEADDFKSKLKKMISNSSVVIFSGSSPCKETDDIFEYGIELANELDKVSILDTYGPHLENCLKKSPTVVHNNFDEIGSSLAMSTKSEEDKINVLDKLYSYGVKLSFLTNGEKPAYASKFDFKYQVKFPEVKTIDPIGSGDAFVAGLTYGMEKAMIFEDFLKFATASGISNARSWETTNSSIEEIEELINQIQLNPIGKKMKLIDDTPVK